jgi:uncharacterized protein (TIGR03435 family)
MEQISRPFLAPVASIPDHSVALPAAASPIPALVFFAWACGFIAVLISHWLRWRRIHFVKRAATPLDLSIRIKVLSSPALLEPAVFGIFRPVLLLPDGITTRLTATQLQAILAHELCHVRRRDNATSALHMLVEAIFWFHPLVWWIGAKLVDEREHACDEVVVQAGNEPQGYAEAILEVCKFYLESPLICAAGVSGANLKRRIERIMTARIGHKLSRGAKLLLATAAIVTVAAPILAGFVNAPVRQTQSPKGEQDPQSIGAATIKPSAGAGRTTVSQSPHELIIKRATLRVLIGMAYNVRGFQISGGPGWMNSDLYDIAATLEGDPILEYLWKDPIAPALQTLLKEKFNLKLHRAMKELPIYSLIVAKSGLKLRRSKEESCAHFEWNRYPLPPGKRPSNYCGAVETGPNIRLNHTLNAVGMSIAGIPGSSPGLITVLSDEVGRTIIDKTGLTGLFDIHLEWNREATARLLNSGVQDGSSKSTSSTDAGNPSIFAAIQDQLGLKFQLDNGPVEILVIDHAEKPSE